MKFLPIAFLLLITAVDQASAATVNYTQDRRSTNYAGSNTNGYVYTYPSAPYADMNGSNQTSSLGADGFTASGYASAYSNYYWSASESLFDITFSVANGTTMTLVGELMGYSPYYTAQASIYLFQGDNQLPANQLYGNSLPNDYYSYDSFASIDYTTLLSAGEYRLVALANPYDMNANSSFGLTASFTTVPVPAAAWLFGSGLLGLIGLSRKRNRC